jgi:glycosyltransferase involved in cell wall biosynthesis
MRRDPANILFFSSFGNLRWGGQKSLYHLVTGLDRSAFRPRVVVPSDDGLARALSEKGVEGCVYDLPRLSPRSILRDLSALRFLLRLIDEREIDLLHTDGPRNTFYAGLAARLRGLPLVWHVRAMDGDPYDRILCRLATRVILVADALKDRFAGLCRTDKLVTIYNGVDLDVFRDVPGDACPEAFAVPPGRLVIASVGRIEPLKGQETLIAACGVLRNAGADFHLLLVGETVDSSYERFCRQKALELGIADRITFVGHRDDMAFLLKGIDIFALPSAIREAFPRSVIEAMACGKPVVVTAGGGAPEAVEEGRSGFVVPPSNPFILAERLSRLAGDPALRKTMGAAARHRAETRFGLEQNARMTQELYRSLLGGRKHVGSHVQSLRA